MLDNGGVPAATLSRPAVRHPDAACCAAIDVARAAAVEVGGEVVGDYLRAQADGERLVTHCFASTHRGYVGWHWAVTVARAPRAKDVTVCEISLLPGPDALVAPEWLPWSERLRPGDLGVGDMLPTAPDDDRLVPGYAAFDNSAWDNSAWDNSAVDNSNSADPAVDDPAVEEVSLRLGLGRLRVLSRLGRLEAAERWYEGDRGPAAPIAQAAPMPCGTCGFYLPLTGSLRAAFGVCANEFAPDDAMVVSADHGCGAHSEALVEASTLPEPGSVILDDALVEVADDAVPVEAAPTEAGRPEDEDPDTESLGHS